jgi:hypothetical protein
MRCFLGRIRMSTPNQHPKSSISTVERMEKMARMNTPNNDVANK